MSLLACILSGIIFLVSVAVAGAVVEWLAAVFHTEASVDGGKASNSAGTATVSNSSMLRVLRRTVSK
jgi:hypothetical protein